MKDQKPTSKNFKQFYVRHSLKETSLSDNTVQSQETYDIQIICIFFRNAIILRWLNIESCEY